MAIYQPYSPSKESETYDHENLTPVAQPFGTNSNQIEETQHFQNKCIMQHQNLNRKMYLEELKTFRPLTKFEQNEYEQKRYNVQGCSWKIITCDMCDREFANATWWSYHKRFEYIECRLR